jgi:hypothetical protein
MRLALAFATLMLTACAQSNQPEVRQRAPCIADKAPLLSLSYEDFDQDLDGGWRPIADIPRCYAASADLLADYQSVRTDLSADERLGVKHHEFQMRAYAGQTDRAIVLIEEIIRDEEHHNNRLYHQAAHAFLKKDRAALLKVRDEMVASPVPEPFAQAVADYAKKYPDRKPLTWPLNLDVVNAFIVCFDETYEVAYGYEACRSGRGVPDFD